MKLDNQSQLLSEVRKRLKYGDQKIIAQVVDCSPELVKKVLSGKRNHRKGKGRKILHVALRVMEIRNWMQELQEGQHKGGKHRD